MVENDPGVDVDKYPTQQIDVGDLGKYNSIANGVSTTGATVEGLIAHAVYEQSKLQNSGINLADQDAVRRQYSLDHEPAVLLENRINGNVRQLDYERRDRNNNILSKTRTKYFKEKNGSLTLEHRTVGTTSMNVTKELNQH